MTGIIGIVGNGPSHMLPDLRTLREAAEVDIWIGADRGALTLLNYELPLNYAIGDFDSVSAAEKKRIQHSAGIYDPYPVEKDWTDLELAVKLARSLAPDRLYLFGLSGGRLDHTLINVQLLVSLAGDSLEAIMVDEQNQLFASVPGTHTVLHDPRYPNISFIPQTRHVTDLTLNGFYYPLEKADIVWGSTLCLSNRLAEIHGTFSYTTGILLLVKSCDKLV